MAIVGNARPIDSRLVLDETFRRQYTSVFEVITDDVTDGPALALTANGIPEFASAYVWFNTTDDWAFCDGATAALKSYDETRKLWTVTVSHSSPKSEGESSSNSRDNSNRPENPTLEPIQISGSFVQFQKAIEKDIHGDPIETTAYEPFVPALEIDDCRDTLIISVNTPKINLLRRAQFKNALNKEPRWGLPKHCWKLAQWRYSKRYYGKSNSYIHNEFEFHANVDENKAGDVIGWKREVLNQGYRELHGLNERDKSQVILIKGEAPTRPVMLDENGEQLEANQDPYYREFDVYKERDYNLLPIPTPLPGPFE